MLLGVIAAGLGLLFGLGNAEVKKFERAAAQEIQSKLQGPDAKVEVHSRMNGLIAGPLGDLKEVTISGRDFSTDGIPLFTEPNRSQRGIIRLLNLDLQNFKLAGLRVERLQAAIPDCRFDYPLALRHRQVRLSRSGVGRGSVILTEGDIEAFILKKFHEIKRVKVRLEKDKVFVDGYGEFLVLTTEFSVIAKLEALNGSQLALSHAKIFFKDKPADEHSSRILLETLNPVVDLNKDLKLYDAIRLEGLKVGQGALEAWGAAQIPITPGLRLP